MDDKKLISTPISKLGEFGLIDHLTSGLVMIHSSTIKGVGDDAAVLEYGNKIILVTTDMLTEGIHFNLEYTPLKHLGYKSAVVNFSDIYAMNGRPKQITISLAISGKFSVEHMDDFYEGLKLACEKYHVDIVGGDTVSSLTGMSISITCIGEADKNKIAYRNGANVNDLICVTGDLGASYLGLQVLERERKLFQQNKNFKPDLKGYDYIIERQLKPENRPEILDLFDQLNVVPTSMIDISDGLSSEVFHICNQSGTGADIYQDKLPIDAETDRVANELNLDSTICALNGGEDYELLFTLPLTAYDEIIKHPEIHIIGRIQPKEKGVNLVTPDGRRIPMAAEGWNPLR